MTLPQLETTAARLSQVVVRTPVLPSKLLKGVFLKAENLQLTGSFKIRAALNQVWALDEEAREKGIVTSSSGNFAQAAAYAAASIGVSAKIVMMKSSNPVKVAGTRRWGGEVVFCEDRFEARAETVDRICRSEGRIPIYPYDHPLVVVGNASIGLEILEALPEVENVVVPISGGGLISGIAVALKLKNPRTKVWGVQPQGSNATFLSFNSGRREKIEKAQTIADGLTVTCPGETTFPIIQKEVHEVVTVEESTIIEATKGLLAEEKLVVEPSGAVTLAAILEGKVPADATVCVLSGGNMDPRKLSQFLSS